MLAAGVVRIFRSSVSFLRISSVINLGFGRDDETAAAAVAEAGSDA
jgi:hypothetical protein